MTTSRDIRGMVRSFGQILADTEWLSPEDLASYQMPLLQKLLAHARDTTRFYRDRLDFDVSDPSAIANHWSRIPFVSRAQAAAERDQLMSGVIPPETGPVTEELTSGSTGTPLKTARSEIMTVATLALTERMMRWWGADGAKNLARIAYDRTGRAQPPDGSVDQGWQAGEPAGQMFVMSHGADVGAQLAWLLRRRPAYLATYSSILRELALASLKAGTDLNFDLVFSIGTTVDDGTRELCRQAFGAEIADSYGAQEAGHLATECKDCREYHVSSEAAVVEVLGSDGAPARPGENGRIVVTPLYNYAMPLIRYEIGDIAEVGAAPASCGRGLPSLRRILGRYRNMFRFRDGTLVWPIIAHFELERFLDCQQAQVVQLDYDRIEIRYVPNSPDTPVDLDALRTRVRRVLRQDVELILTPLDRIERSASGKFEDCLSLVSSDT